MTWIRRLGRTQLATQPSPAVLPEGPPPTRLPLSSDGANPIHRVLGAWRLPWETSRREVEANVGIRPHPFYPWQTLLFEQAICPPGAIQPWSGSIHPHSPPQFPITAFSTLVWFEDDAHRNLERAAAHMARHLGPATIGRHWNTLLCEWKCETALISIVAWPPEWQTHGLTNDSHNRHPQLRTACRFTIASGFRLAQSARERHWVASFAALNWKGAMSQSLDRLLGDRAPGEADLEYARDPDPMPDISEGCVGLSADGEALIFASGQLYVVPRKDVLGFRVVRLTPAKGTGGSSLYVKLRTQASIDAQMLTIAQASDPDGVNLLGESLAQRLDCAIDIEPYRPDI